jgi:hypothetical protein
MFFQAGLDRANQLDCEAEFPSARTCRDPVAALNASIENVNLIAQA